MIKLPKPASELNLLDFRNIWNSIFLMPAPDKKVEQFGGGSDGQGFGGFELTDTRIGTKIKIAGNLGECLLSSVAYYQPNKGRWIEINEEERSEIENLLNKQP
jgi:hypothetical protein